MLSRLRKRDLGPPPDPNCVNYTREHVKLAKTIARRRKVLGSIWSHIPLLRVLLTCAGVIWLLALPYEGLWKRTYVDEHALQPAQVTMYFDWVEVHKADLYLGQLEGLVNSTFEDRSQYLQNAFSASGLQTGGTHNSTYAHVTPPRSAGTETILLSANWISRDGGPNLRGIATLLALGDFFRGQNHWAFDFVLVVGDGYMSGLEDFMRSYHSLFSGVIWTGLNIDYPGHSFSHVGLLYEGVNGRLPNQDVVNTVSHVARHAGGVLTRLHDIQDEPSHFGTEWMGNYLLAAKHLVHHFAYMAFGRPTAAHGVLARHRIDSLTLYATPATGPHGFHTLGRTLESTLRSLNNLLERLHASYFFYLLPRPERFIPVGNYLPAAVLLGASLTIGGFDCPDPLGGLAYLMRSFMISVIAWIFHFPLIAGHHLILPRPQGDTRKSVKSLALLLYGAIIPTLAMINFPQSILLALLAHLYLTTPYMIRLVITALQPGLLVILLKAYFGVDLEAEWKEVGNLAYVGLYAVVLPLWDISALLLL